ncbi:protein adenylyltransferase SelO [Evansella cellulosilytica]|uniref:Protein nucleotidyltransferase YdiU n=1 Tax=Evansella cellulosilytica (strain ATCC 21833 / DSM 2522 / FERM P-1141 / JCM 9156 / N-4) TaxID=649639 RepID=E6TWS6_EVAC2|nr:YdiU family protein [Evansella cellulosilytica]ADU28759.1 protein of unknown function UPF0061 [Evansella cellulosilytica DSM 2522]
MDNKIGWNLENSYTKLPDTFYSTLNPTTVSSPKLVIFNEKLATSLGLNGEELKGTSGVEVFAGNNLPPASKPLAQAYAGHQFGHFTMLGDGRAILLGEQITPNNERIDIQLKGAGRTPYSRGGDGRASLGPMLREYIISEAMDALNIPTTRSLAVVTTGEDVYRETVLPGAILTRTAASHLRVGTFEYAAKWATDDELKQLADYAINRHYSEIVAKEDQYRLFLQEVIKRQAELIAKWQLVGFIHGVMNTDNMTISGETIDYGPCAFMDEYDPKTVFSSIDREGRYAYGNQPYIGAWNVSRLAEAILPLLHDDQEEAVNIAQEEIGKYKDLYLSYWHTGMKAKLGIINDEADDERLIEELLMLMQQHSADFTNTFRALTLDKIEGMALFETDAFKKWYERWKARIGRQEEPISASIALMKKSNPAVIPRNHLVEEALDAAVEDGDYAVMERLLHVLEKPFDYTLEKEKFTAPAPPEVSCNYKTFCGT